MTAPLVEWYRNEVLCDLVEVEPQGQIHIGVASTMLEEAKKITACYLTLNMRNINALKALPKSVDLWISGRAKEKP